MDSSGDIYVGGVTSSFCCGAFLLKYNATGYLLWQQVLFRNNTSPYYDSAVNAIAVDSTENVYLVGYADSSITGRDVLLAKFDPNGNPQWLERWGGNSSDAGQGIAIDRLGAIYVTGSTSSYTYSGSQNILVLKLNANGSLVWQKIWNDLGYRSGTGISVDNSGNLYISGTEASSQNSFPSPLLMKVNSTGSLKWIKSWDLSNQNSYYFTTTANAVTVDSAGSAYVTGSTTYGLNGLYYTGIPIMKFDPDGTVAWQKLWVVTAVNYCCQPSQNGNSVALDQTGDVFITGQASYYSSQTIPIGFLILELSPKGDLEWQTTTATNNGDIGTSITVDTSGNAVAVGDINEAPPSSLHLLNFPLLRGNFTLQTIMGSLASTNATVSPINVIISRNIGVQTYSGQGDAYLLKLQLPTPSPPSPPLALVAQANQNNISLSWAPPQYTGGYPVTGYNIYKGLSAGKETLLANTPALHSYVDTNVKSGVTYYYYVKAVNSLGESDASNENYAIPGASTAMIIPINPTTVGGAAVIIVGVAGFVVYQRRKRTLHFG